MVGMVCLPVLNSTTSKLPGSGKLQWTPVTVTLLTLSLAPAFFGVLCDAITHFATWGKENKSRPIYRIEKVDGAAFTY